MWQPVISRLQDLPGVGGQSAEFVAMDMPGHGDSPFPFAKADENTNWPALVRNAVHQVMSTKVKELQYSSERPKLAAAHSYGATAVLFHEAQHPGTFQRILAYEPIVYPFKPSYDAGQSPVVEKALRQTSTWPSLDKAREHFSTNRVFRSFHPEMMDLYLKHALRQELGGRALLICTPEVEASCYASLSTVTVDDLSPMTSDCMIFHGEDSFHTQLMTKLSGISEPYYDRIASHLPGTKKSVMIPGVASFVRDGATGRDC